jgi:hypothetical protein
MKETECKDFAPDAEEKSCPSPDPELDEEAALSFLTSYDQPTTMSGVDL